MKVAFYPEIEKLTGNPYWNMLASGLQQRGVEIVPGGNGGRRWLLKNRGKVQVLHYHFVQQFYGYEKTQARLRWVLRFMLNLLFAKLLGYQTVFTVHDLKPTWPLLPRWVDYLGHWAAVNLCNQVIVHCQIAAKSVRSVYGRKSAIRIVTHANYCEYYPNLITKLEARKLLGIEDGSKVFGFLGGIRPNKGVEKLIDSFKRIDADDAVLLIAGKSWPPFEYTQNLLNLVREDQRIRVQIGFVPDERVQIYLNAMDWVVLPFQEILTSGSTLLAMSFARPVIVPQSGCLPEILKPGTGISYSPDRPTGLDEAMQKALLMNADIMGQQAFEQVRPFTLQRMADETLRVYGGEKK